MVTVKKNDFLFETIDTSNQVLYGPDALSISISKKEMFSLYDMYGRHCMGYCMCTYFSGIHILPELVLHQYVLILAGFIF